MNGFGSGNNHETNVPKETCPCFYVPRENMAGGTMHACNTSPPFPVASFHLTRATRPEFVSRCRCGLSWFNRPSTQVRETHLFMEHTVLFALRKLSSSGRAISVTAQPHMDIVFVGLSWDLRILGDAPILRHFTFFVLITYLAGAR